MARAAVSETETASLAIGRDVLANKLDKLNGVSEDIVSLKESSDAKLNTIHQDICNLKDEMAKVSQALQTEAKMQQIRFAIGHAEKRQDIKYRDDVNYQTSQSIREHLLTPILSNFMRGYGQYLPHKARIFNGNNNNDNEKGYEDFRSQVVFELHALLGQKPRLNKETNGKHAVYYD